MPSVRGGSVRVADQTPAGETADQVDPGRIAALFADRFGMVGWTLDGRGVPVPAEPT